MKNLILFIACFLNYNFVFAQCFTDFSINPEYVDYCEFYCASPPSSPSDSSPLSFCVVMGEAPSTDIDGVFDLVVTLNDNIYASATLPYDAASIVTVYDHMEGSGYTFNFADFDDSSCGTTYEYGGVYIDCSCSLDYIINNVSCDASNNITFDIIATAPNMDNDNTFEITYGWDGSNTTSLSYGQTHTLSYNAESNDYIPISLTEPDMFFFSFGGEGYDEIHCVNSLGCALDDLIVQEVICDDNGTDMLVDNTITLEFYATLDGATAGHTYRILEYTAGNHRKVLESFYSYNYNQSYQYTFTTYGLTHIDIVVRDNNYQDCIISFPVYCNTQCESNLSLNDDPMTTGVYQSQNTINSAGNVPSNGNVALFATESIELEADFTVEQGALFSADTNNDCNPSAIGQEATDKKR